MVPAEPSPTRLICGGHGGCRGDLGGGLSESFDFMKLLQQVQELSDVNDDKDKNEACLGSVQHNNDKKEDEVKHIINKRDCRSDNHNSSFMADREEPRTNSGSSSKDDNNNEGNTYADTNTDTGLNNQEEMREEGWLRLSIGGQTGEAKPDEETGLDRSQVHSGDDHQADLTTGREDPMLELNLFSGDLSRYPGQEEVQPMALPFANTGLGIGPSLLHQYHHQGGGMMSPLVFPAGHEQMLGSWTAFRQPFVQQNLTRSPSLMMPLMGPYFARSMLQSQLMGTSSYTDGPSSSFRAVDPPRRPHSGIWFVLQASENQTREPFLPQIPKSYLRIKDGRMTVRLLMKYLVNKLRLEHESEVEIRCRGEQLEPVLTLQDVRDRIWRTSARENISQQHITLLPNSPTSHHLMLLHYGRSLS
ncbi:PREDICTED: uncharacterized protein LOC104825469 [Tarenaya hassleriana]|uniref:uncharacterized protein LOC104825469 n=1 Tax=Tarenaya hassleriana TaxID=28532 RepID=UPI00053C2E0A|nr:PREDICTED: uncharacterized protein LOC104825469 [Tarenaya hassleriana]